MADAAPWRHVDARILLFAKAPEAGQVKTRLGKAIGYAEAARAYAAWLEDTVLRLSAARLCQLELWASPNTGHPLFQRLAETTGIELHTQPPGNLGQRMHEALSHTLARRRQAVIIGGDCPVMPVNYIERALDALTQGIDTIIGPSEDGGYVLLGLNKMVPALFSNIPWSTRAVMRTTRRRLIAAHAYWAELETLWDIDEAIDYRRWLQMTPQRSGRPFTLQEIEVSKP